MKNINKLYFTLSVLLITVISYAQTDSTTLEKVTVNKRLPSPVTIVNDRYASRGMNGNYVITSGRVKYF